MDEFLLVLTGGAVSLASSATVTWLQTRHAYRGEARAATRESTRRLTALFIAERDAALMGEGPSAGLAEAETLAVALADRRTRERVRDAVRLLRELHLTELQELSGQRAAPGRRMLCDHALEVLGAHFRGEKVPAAPQGMQKMLDVEDEALSIRSGALPGRSAGAAAAASAASGFRSAEGAESGAGSAGEGADEEPSSGSSASTSTGSSRSSEASASSTRKPGRRPRAKARTKDPEDSDFWNE
ncbi:hypothetical protein O4J56_30030 [Nocardiopsis sp. RSe5-2]|uniref:Uncharacterized protein n=1 Tax=Nocardiopsis endophytica TaxID=3018445 RepID=A0ABT4UD58_9ACTN|nr:hypothetical protein [Nocardiopsis endophytica]MDA2814922.1 hypothetical protein [Nocardiopsis endophytica]